MHVLESPYVCDGVDKTAFTFHQHKQEQADSRAKRACGVHLASLDLHSLWQSPFCLRTLGGGSFPTPHIMLDNTHAHTHTPTTTS